MNTLVMVFAALILTGLSLSPQAGGSSPSKGVTTQEQRWAKAEIRRDKRHAVERIVKKIKSSKPRYRSVAKETGVPWWAIAGIHNMESSLSFSRHLHEGSLLSGRTKYVPKGRPKKGRPPFTWEESAKDALEYDKMGRVNWQKLHDALQAVEMYNGAGYQKYHKDVPSPYLWSYTNVYSRGKYVSDGRWSSTAVSKQCGAAAIWKVILEQDNKDLPVNFH